MQKQKLTTQTATVQIVDEVFLHSKSCLFKNAKEEAETTEMVKCNDEETGKGAVQVGGFLPAQSLRSLSHRWVCLTTNFIASMKQATERRKLCSSMLASGSWKRKELKTGTGKRSCSEVRLTRFHFQKLNSQKEQGLSFANKLPILTIVFAEHCFLLPN